MPGLDEHLVLTNVAKWQVEYWSARPCTFTSLESYVLAAALSHQLWMGRQCQNRVVVFRFVPRQNQDTGEEAWRDGRGGMTWLMGYASAQGRDGCTIVPPVYIV